MYMGVILMIGSVATAAAGAPHVYGGDPSFSSVFNSVPNVLPMYMGVTLQ